MMLVHIKQAEVAACIHNAWLATLEEGIHIADLHTTNSQRQVSTNEFAEAVIQYLGQLPEGFKAVSYQNAAEPSQPSFRYQREQPAQSGAMQSRCWRRNLLL